LAGFLTFTDLPRAPNLQTETPLPKLQPTTLVPQRWESSRLKVTVTLTDLTDLTDLIALIYLTD
jgi:hypothetical protein